MPHRIDRRDLLKRLTLGGAAVGVTAAGVFVPGTGYAAAQRTPPRAGVPRTRVSRVSLADGIVAHSGETAMELYHAHPHLQREEIVQPEDIRLQTRLTMRNHKEILDWAGLSWTDVVRVTRFQTRLDESPAIEAVMADYFRDSWPPMTVYEVDGLSSPQARVEIEMWVAARPGVRRHAAPAPVAGLASILPRPEIVTSTGYAPAILVEPSMDLVFVSGLTVYPFDVDPWNPGSFRIPNDPAARATLTAGHLDAVVQAAGISWQHLVFRVSFTAPGGGGVDFAARQREWRSCSTTLRVKDTGVPGANVLYQMTAAAPRRPAVARGPMPGIEPVLFTPGMSLSPAVRVSSDLDLLYFSGLTAYPPDVDPWNPGRFRLPQDGAAEEALLLQNVERALASAGVGWPNVVVLNRTGEGAARSTMTERMGAWRPCRTTRVVPSGVPGATVLCDIIAAAPRRRR